MKGFLVIRGRPGPFTYALCVIRSESQGEHSSTYMTLGLNPFTYVEQFQWVEEVVQDLI